MARVAEALRARGLELDRNRRLPCPAHGGTDANLAINQGHRGVVFKCHSHDCPTEAIAAAIGISVAQLFDDYDERRSTTDPLRRLDYVYHDEHGRPLSRAVRREDWQTGKKAGTPPIWQERYNPTTGRFVGGKAAMDGVRRVLLNLPAIIAANPTETIFIVEGEKAAVTLSERFGVIATTSPEGAGKWRGSKNGGDPRYAEWLVGRDVVILPDNDAQGRKHAADIVADLIGKATRVRVVELPSLPEKGDVVDWLSGGGTRDEFLALVDEAPEAGSTDPISVEAGASEPPVKVNTIRAADVKSERVTWIWPGYVPAGKLTVLEGYPDKGKSTFTTTLAASVSTGNPLPGMSAAPPANVILISYEDGEGDTIRPRLEAAGADLDRVEIVQGLGDDNLPFTLPDHLTALDWLVRSRGARLVVVDPISAALSNSVDSWRDTDVRRVLSRLAKLAEATGAAIVIVRHVNKSAASGKAIVAGGGSIGIIGQARVGLLIDEQPENPADRVLAVVKCNVARKAPSLRFGFVDTELGVARLEWKGETEHSADDLTARRSASARDVEAEEERQEAQRDASEFLRRVLGDGEWCESRKIRELATADGLTWRTVQRTSKQMFVEVARQGFGKDKSHDVALHRPRTVHSRQCSTYTGTLARL